jgi:hypothetical protein
MGFIARTIFWLGLVYSAMPLDFGSLFSDRPPGMADANPLAACARGVTEDCRQRVGELRKALDAAAAHGIVDRVVAATETLVSADTPTPPRKPAQIHP